MTAHDSTADTGLHPLVDAYLATLRQQALALPPEPAAELVSDIAGHLREALSPDAGEAEVRTVLDRLGSPAALVAAAGAPVAAPPAYAVSSAPTFGVVEALALVALVGAELLAFLFPFVALLWLAGGVLLAVSAVWSPRDKLRGLLGLVTGFPLAFLTLVMSAGATVTSCDGVSSGVTVDGRVVTSPEQVSCTTTGGWPSWAYAVSTGLLVAYLCFQGWTLWRLTRARSR